VTFFTLHCGFFKLSFVGPRLVVEMRVDGVRWLAQVSGPGEALRVEGVRRLSHIWCMTNADHESVGTAEQKGMYWKTTVPVAFSSERTAKGFQWFVQDWAPATHASRPRLKHKDGRGTEGRGFCWLPRSGYSIRIEGRFVRRCLAMK